MPTSGKPSFEIPTRVLQRQVDEQMVLLNLESEQYFGLNQVGRHIITRLTEAPFEEALRILADDYQVGPDLLRRDVHNLVDALLEAGLLERTDTDDRGAH